MKRLTALFLAALFFCLCLTACGQAKEYAPYIEQSKEISMLLQKGEYEEVRALFRTDMQASVKIEDWETIFPGKFAQLGEFKKFGASSAVKRNVLETLIKSADAKLEQSGNSGSTNQNPGDEGEHIIVTLNSRFENGDWEMRFYYDLSGKLVAIFV